MNSTALIPSAIFPNPVHDIFSISDFQNISSVKIYSIEGKNILNFTSKNEKKSFDVSSLQSGIYIVEYYSGEEKYIVKIVKE